MAGIIYRDSYTAAWYGLYINYYANGGGTVPTDQSTFNHTSASSVTVSLDISSTTPVRSGYRFLGYATSANGSVQYQPGQRVSKYFTRNAYYSHDEESREGANVVVTSYYISTDQSYAYNLYAKWEASASPVSTTDGTLGTAQTISITASDPSYTHTLRYEFAGETGTIASSVASSYSWTPALTMAQLIPAAVSATCTIFCDTYSGSTLLGTTQTTCTLSVPSTVKCTVASVVLAETVAGINAKFSAFVQNKSKVSVTGTFNQGNVSPSYGATVSAVSININGQVLTTNGAVTNLLYTSGTNSYTLTITDTRGRTDSYTSTFNVLAYTAPSASETAERNSTTNTTIDVSYAWTISPCSDLNDKALSIAYGPVGGIQTTVNITPSSYSGTGTYAITGTDPNDTYNVTLTVTDYFGSASASSPVSATGNRVYRVSKADKRMIFYNGIQLGSTVLTEAQLQALLALI